MPHLTISDRDKLSNLAKDGNEDAVFFLGQTEQTQKRNYYRGWKILADQGDAEAIGRLNEERERLRTNHEQRVAMIAAGVDEGLEVGDVPVPARLPEQVLSTASIISSLPSGITHRPDNFHEMLSALRKASSVSRVCCKSSPSRARNNDLTFCVELGLLCWSETLLVHS